MMSPGGDGLGSHSPDAKAGSLVGHNMPIARVDDEWSISFDQRTGERVAYPVPEPRIDDGERWDFHVPARTPHRNTPR